MWGIEYVAAILLALPPVSGPAWRSVLTDWLEHGRFAQPHPCADVLVAWGRSELISWPNGDALTALRREARRACPVGSPSLIRPGMSDAAVAVVAGRPRLQLTGPRCWVYPTRRACFTAGRVSTLQTVDHG